MELTSRMAREIISHEAIVPECYKDSVGVWTWGVGVTNASGHQVYPRYLDKPQTIKRCLEVYLWLLKERYVPAVEAAFAGHALTQAQATAALSFHFNTGSIGSAAWVRQFKAGDVAGARLAIMNWKRPPEILGRRRAERNLFFDGQWSGQGKATVYDVRKPGYTPNWSSARKVDVSDIIAELLD